MEKVIAIVGPTAVGKTKVSLDLARRLQTSIISGDSMLVYQGLDIGTAKPTIQEQAEITHYLINIRDPGEEFSVADFQQLAAAQIAKINEQGQIAIIAGGTGLYIKALIEGYDLTNPSGDEKLRKQLQQLADEHGNEYLHQMLRLQDPIKASSLHQNDVRRIIRALEVRILSGTQPIKTTIFPRLQYDSMVIGLSMKRERLYERINQRVDDMLESGLVQEVRQLIAKGVPVNAQSMQAIGYKQLVGYISGECSLPDAVNAIKQASRQFAKRQMTWYRKMPYITWISVDDFSNHSAMMEHIYNIVAERFGIE